MSWSCPVVGERLSENYYVRKDYLANDIIPLHKEIRHNLGDALTDVYFSQMEEDGKVMLGLRLPLEGPGDQLWVNPIDELNDMPKLKPVTTNEIKALTHQGILEIGEGILKKQYEEEERNIRKAIANNDETWKWLAKEHCRMCVKTAVKRERKTQQEDVWSIIDEYNKAYKEGIQSTQQQYSLLIEEKVEEMKEKMAHMYRLEKEAALLDLFKQMEEECNIKVKLETLKLKEHFDEVMMLEHARFTHVLNERHRTLRHQLECRGVVDVLYTACTERHLYLMKQEIIEKEYMGQIDVLKRQLEFYKKCLDEVEKKMSITEDEDKILKDNMRVLCREFRKIFSYHTNLPPTQLGFLPNLEEMFIDSVKGKERSKDKPPVEGESQTSQEKENTERASRCTDGTFEPQFSKQSSGDTRPVIIYSDMTDKSAVEKTVYGDDEPIPSELYLPAWLMNGSEVSSKRASSTSDGKYSLFVPKGKSVSISEDDSRKCLESEYGIPKYSEIIQKASMGLRTSILKRSTVSSSSQSFRSDSLLQQQTTNEDIREFSDSKLSEYKDSLTLIKEVQKSTHECKITHMKASGNNLIKDCPVPDCKFKTVLDFDMPPHLAHLAIANFNKTQDYSYANYENFSKDELRLLVEKYQRAEADIKQRESSETSALDNGAILEAARTEEIASGSHVCCCTLVCPVCNTKLPLQNEMDENKGNQEGVKDRLCNEKKEFTIVGDKENEDHLGLKSKCMTQHTLESIKQIFTDNPSFAHSFIDMGCL